jgi:hypothetical protein
MTINCFDQFPLDCQFQGVDEFLTDASESTGTSIAGKPVIGQFQGCFIDTFSIQESLAVWDGYGIV